MKTTTKILLTALMTATFLFVGCDSADDMPVEPTPTPEVEAPDTPAASTPPPSANTAASAADQVKQLASDTTQAAKDTVAAATAKLTESVQGQSDSKVKELAKSLTQKVQEFSSTLTSDAPLKEKLQSAVGSLSAGEDGESLGALQQIKQANLTPEQNQLIGEVQNVWSALVVQRNFAGLETSEGEVGKIVSALQGGDSATALTHLKQLAAKAALTPEQKDLLNKVVAQYAPGLEDAGAAVQEGLKGLNPFDK